MLKIIELETYYGNIHALKGISLKVERGSIVTILGANGSGKTTLLRTISGLILPKKGKIEFEGKKIEGESPHKIVRAGISHVPEGRELFPGLTVFENLIMGAYIRKEMREIKKDLDTIYKYFPILKKREKQVSSSLSGGEQQMLVIGRALMSRPKLLLLDEPSLGLAPIIVEEIYKIIQAINFEGTTILLVEQNARLALTIAHAGYVFETGKVAVYGKSNELLQNELVKKAYLGK